MLKVARLALVLALPLVALGCDRPSSRYQMAVAGGSATGGLIVYRLDRRSGEICAYGLATKDQVGVARLNCVKDSD